MKKLMVILFMVATMICQAQVKQDLRVEFSTEDKESAFVVVPVGDKGLIAVTLEDLPKGLVAWEFTKLDIMMVEQEKVILKLETRYYLIGQEAQGNRVLFVFEDARSGKMKLVELNIQTMKYEIIECLKVPRRVLLGGIRLVGRTAFVCLSFKSKVYLIAADFEENSYKINQIQVPNMKKISFEGMESTADQSSLFFFVGCKLKSKEFTTQVQQWNNKGEKIDSYFLPKLRGYRYSSVTCTKVSEDQMIFCGTYSVNSTNTATGCFITSMKDGKSEYFTHLSFMDLENYKEYITKFATFGATSAIAKAMGAKLEVTFPAVNHPVLMVNDKLYMVCEFYRPVYTKYTNGKGETYTVFEGNQYTHAVVICFDKEGEKLWENIFEVFPSHLPKRVVEMVAVSVTGDGNVSMLFSSRNKIYSKVFDDNGKVIADKQKSKIEGFATNDKTKSTTSFLEYWYGEHFIAYGEQKVKSQGSKKRKVFFINKVSPD